MKKSILIALTSGVLASAFLFLGTNNNASAASVVTTRNDVAQTHLYDNAGKLITDRALAANTDWIIGKTIVVGDNTFYQVSTDEYVNANDVSFRSPSSVIPSGTDSSNTNVQVSTNYPTIPVFNGQTGKIESWINNGENYRVGRAIKNSLGITYYQVSTNGYVVDGLVQVSGTPNTTYIANFNPIRAYQGTQPVQVRRQLAQNVNINQSVLNTIPNDLITTEYTISNYAGEDITGFYSRLKAFYPNL